MMLGAVAMPFADASAADGKIAYVDLRKENSATVLIEYGSKIEDVDFVVEDMESLGIKVKLQAGYTNESCGLVTINGKSVEFDQDSVYGGELGSFIHWEFKGKTTDAEDMPKCDVKP